MNEPAYQPYFCEENAWKLCASRLAEEGSDPEEWAVVFISNRQRACPLWHQAAAPDPRQPVLWDYHVVVLHRLERGFDIWDLDTTLGFPIAAEVWWSATFEGLSDFPEPFHPSFRVIPADEYLETFSSDRSHMRGGEGWKQPPPEWPAIFQPERGMNLERFIDTTRPGPGRVLTASAFRELYAARPE